MEVHQCKWNLNGVCSRVLEYFGCDCPVSKRPNLCTKYEPVTMIYVNYDRLIEFFDELKKTERQEEEIKIIKMWLTDFTL